MSKMNKSFKAKLLCCVLTAVMAVSFMPIFGGVDNAGAAAKLPAPLVLHGQSAGKTAVKLSWSKVKGASKYVVYRSGGKKYTVKGTSLTVRMLKKDKVYGFKVKAGKKGKYSRYSYTIKVKGTPGKNKIRNARKIRLNSSKIVLEPGKTTVLKAYLSPSKKIVSGKVTWTSTNKAIASVNKSGTVKGIKDGTCYVYARNHSGFRAKCKVTVSEKRTIIKNGRVEQVKGDVKNPTAVVTQGDEILYVGSDSGADKYNAGNAEVINANGGTIMPSLTDSHMHVSSSTSYMYEIPLYDLGKADMMATIKTFIADNPDLNVYVGAGWQVSLFDENGPTKAELDAICADKPIILTSADGHSSWVNSKALEKAGITDETADPEGGEIIRDGSGHATGYLKEAASGLVSDMKPTYTVDQMKKAILWEQDWFAGKGFTSMFDARMYLEDDKNYYTAMEELAEAGQLKLRIRSSWWIQPYMFENWDECKAYMDKCFAAEKQFKTDYFRVNTVKLMADQVLEEATAYMSDGYYEDYGDHSKGKKADNEKNKLWGEKMDMLKNVLKYADDNDQQIHIHQIGDAAATYMLDVIEELQETTNPDIKDHRICFAHCQFINDADQKRMAKLGISAIVAPYWAVMDDYYWDVYEPMVGTDTLDKQYPMKSLVKNGVNVAIHSDWFVTEPDMGWLYYSAVTRTLPQKMFNTWYGADTEGYIRITDPTASQEKYYEGKLTIAPLKQYSERLSLKDIINASTYGGAKTIKLENEIGSLEAGKKADIIVLNTNLYETDTADLENIAPVYTMFDGQIVYDKSKEQ
ncbi:MAG: amidohydrolase family protein [Eubacteriaceae bacterium]|nr:amidohydrolase family protein [Eubacteriaceae bacterium]